MQLKGVWNGGKSREQYARRYHYFPIGFTTSPCGVEISFMAPMLESEPYHACAKCKAAIEKKAKQTIQDWTEDWQ
jgi:hypothetical protein